jgi:hypothetical protein
LGLDTGVLVTWSWVESCDVAEEAVAPPMALAASSRPVERLRRLPARVFLLVIAVLPIRWGGPGGTPGD